ncbi:MAG: UbiA family prenyltransferase [Candidatus Zixiibacteriota bacterium]
MKKILDYIFLMRPMLIVPVWTISLLGARAALWRERGISPVTIDRFPFVDFTSSDISLLVMLALSTLLAGGVFIINQIYDVESDRLNKKLFLIPEGHVSISEAWGLYIATTAIALIGAFVLSWQLGCLFVAGAWFGFQYSYPLFKLREHPYKQCRNNIVAHGTLAFLFGWVMYLNFDIEGIIRSLPYLLAVAAVYLNTTLPDVAGDQATGKRTYGIEWGVVRTQKVAFTLVLSGALFSVMIADYAFTVTALISLPFFLVAWLKESEPLSALASKVAIIVLSIFAALFFPLYAAILAVTIIATRIYYARRFNLNYPVLTEKH